MLVLWAVKIGEPDYFENVIFESETNNETDIKNAMKQAKLNGYDRFRIARYSDIPDKPDFVKTIRI